MGLVAEPLATSSAQVGRRVGGAPLALRTGIILLGLLALVALFAPIFGSPRFQDFTHGLTLDGFPVGISRRFPLGTDTLGRDLLARLAYGARTSLVVALVSNATSLLIATLIGVLAGFYRRWLEVVLMRLTDAALSIPFVLAAFVLAAFLPAGLLRAIVIITALFWAYPARLIYGEVLGLRRRGFIDAAEASGARGTWTIRRHVIRHLAPLIVTYSPLNAAAAVMFESALSYLGAGINPPTPSWGNMISDGQAALGYAPRLLIAPSLFLATTVLAFLLIGEGMKSRSRALSRDSWLDV